MTERRFTWHESISGWEAARIGYVRQCAAEQAARAKAMEPLPEVHGPSVPMPWNYDPCVSGVWDGRPKRLPAPASPVSAPAAPAKYDYNRDDSWKGFVKQTAAFARRFAAGGKHD